MTADNSDSPPEGLSAREAARSARLGFHFLFLLAFSLAAANVGLGLFANFHPRERFDEGKDILYLQSVGGTIRFANGRMNLEQNSFVRFLLEPGVKIEEVEARVKLTPNSYALFGFRVNEGNYYGLRLSSSPETPNEVLKFQGGAEAAKWPLDAPFLEEGRSHRVRIRMNPDGAEFFLDGSSIGSMRDASFRGGSLAFTCGWNKVKLDDLLVTGVKEDGSPYRYKESFGSWPIKRRWLPIVFPILFLLGFLYSTTALIGLKWGTSHTVRKLAGDAADRLFPLLFFFTPAALPFVPFYAALVLFLSALFVYHSQLFGYFIGENHVFRLDGKARRGGTEAAAAGGKRRVSWAFPAAGAVFLSIYAGGQWLCDTAMDRMLAADGIDLALFDKTLYSEPEERKIDAGHPLIVLDPVVFYEAAEKEEGAALNDRAVDSVLQILERNDTRDGFFIDPYLTRRLTQKNALDATAMRIVLEFFPEKGDWFSLEFFKRLELRQKKEPIYSQLGAHVYFAFLAGAGPNVENLLAYVNNAKVYKTPARMLGGTSAAEARPGEWNRVEIQAVRGLAKAYLNGKLLDYNTQTNLFERCNVVNISPLSKSIRVRGLTVQGSSRETTAAPKGMSRYRTGETVEVYSGLLLLLFAIASIVSPLCAVPAPAFFSILLKTVFFQMGVFLLPTLFLYRVGLPVFLLIPFYGMAVFFASVLYLCIYLTNRRTFRFRPFAALGGVALIAGLVELGAPAFSPLQTMSKYAWHERLSSPETYWFFDPNARRHNHYYDFHALRLRRYGVKEAGEKRIVALGGSQTWGEGTAFADPNIFPFLLEDKLNQADPERRWTVIDGANGSSNSFSQLQFFKGALLDYEPDYAILNFTHNDLKVERGNMDRYAAYERANALPFQWKDRHRLYTPLLLGRYSLRGGDKIVYQAVMAGADRIIQFPGLGFLRPLYRRELASNENKFKYFRKNLEAFQDLAREHGVKIILSKEPFLSEHEEMMDKDILRNYTSLEESGARHGRPVIDTHGEMLKYKNENLFLDALHLTPHGHQRMAQIFFKHLVENGLLAEFHKAPEDKNGAAEGDGAPNGDGTGDGLKKAPGDRR